MEPGRVIQKKVIYFLVYLLLNGFQRICREHYLYVLQAFEFFFFKGDETDS